MPRQIVQLRDELLKAAKRRLLLQGYKKMTVRDVASDCRIAVGTVYNYFSSKEKLVEAVMAKDWNSILDAAREESEKAMSVCDALLVLFNGIAAFAKIYRPVWEAYAEIVPMAEVPRVHYEAVVQQLSDFIERLCIQSDCLFCSSLPRFLAESVLCGALCPCGCFEKLAPIYARLTERR